MSREEIEKAAIEKYGEFWQAVKAVEEMGELTQALAKWMHRPTIENRKAVMEELADVTIMTEQMHLIFGSTLGIEEAKLERLSGRMRE